MTVELDPRITEELKRLYTSQKDQGKLLSREQLAEYYHTFRNRFGPDKLRNLDGEALLNLMHSTGNKDSLVYWLEFKDDEEFHSPRLGSIAGGSAHKYSLFRRKETGRWTSGSPQHEEELTLEQAIAIARQHRDQLLAGVRLLQELPENGSDEDYLHLQQEMDSMVDSTVPNITNSAWGHKYFSLLYPEKLDDFHNPDLQRFHLIRQLELPPSGKGRYLAAGRFVAIAHTLAIPMNNLTTLLNERDGRAAYSYWRVGTTSDVEKPRNHWAMMRDSSCIAIGWSNLGDLSKITNDRNGKDEIFQLLLTRHGYTNRASAGKAAQQTFNFIWGININDLVLASDGATILGIGRVTGEYRYDPSLDFSQCRPVEWLSLEEWQQPDRQPDFEGKLTTVYRMKRPRNLLEVEKRIYGASPIIISLPPKPLDTIEESRPPIPIPRLEGYPGRIQAILERKGQVILYGPPGTGKTYWAEYTARELAARSNFGLPFEQLSVTQKAELLGDNNHDQGSVRMCSFHPAYGYEDFLEGFRPKVVNGQMQFVLRDGIFKKLCKDAEAHSNQKFYLIIDEINRGDIPRIFGELLTVLEKDKRGKTVLLPLTETPFRVPENVYIIGTMNTADRSIALLDTALRRRFGFIELMPDISVLGNTTLDGVPLGPWLKALNERICANVGRDARNLQIGHSYLLEKERPIGDFAAFARVLQEDILPLLEEYCYEDFTTLEKILGTSLIDVQNQQVHHELFDLSNRNLLAQALLAPDPDITTSAQALSSEAQAVDDDEVEDDDDNVSGLL
ncbi:MAG TPA: AAA family ATPase [Ktedonobacteraceae bacterium]|nr:AAA family ATPase [Ktedonobacteraceae bacterium]